MTDNNLQVPYTYFDPAVVLASNPKPMIGFTPPIANEGCILLVWTEIPKNEDYIKWSLTLFFIVKPWFSNSYKITWTSFTCIYVYKYWNNLNRVVFTILMYRGHLLTCLDLSWVKVIQNEVLQYFSYPWNYDFHILTKWLGNHLYMSFYRKIVVSYNFHMLNLIIKAFWLLGESKFL